MKVVYLDHCADMSGGEIALARLLSALRGIDAHVILGEEGPLRQVLEAQGVAVEVRVLDERTRKTGRRSINQGLGTVWLGIRVLAHAWRLSRRLRQVKPDLIHTNSLKSAVYGSLAGWMAHIPVVCHLRDRLATDYMSASGVRLMRLVLRALPVAVIANSMETLSTLTPSTTALRVFGAVAPDPVVTQRIGAGEPSEELVVGMVGRLAPWKGQHIFIEAFSRAFPEGGAKALILGSAMFAEDDYEAELQQQVRDLHMGDRIELLGFVNQASSYLGQFDILVHASVIPEPFGQAVAEGMAAGIPVIAANAGGPSELITNGISGILYPPGDVDALATALRELGGSRQRRLGMGAAARVKSAEFRPERVAEQVLAVYRVLVPAASF